MENSHQLTIVPNTQLGMIEQIQKGLPDSGPVEIVTLPPPKPKTTTLRIPRQNVDREYERFKQWMRDNKHNPIWRYIQISKQKYTRSRPTATNRETRNFGLEPNFTDVKLRKTSVYCDWMTKDKYKEDYIALFKLGNPLKKESEGGLKWERILAFIYNSGEMEGCRKKNNFDPKMKNDIFFPSGKCDNGRCITQFLNRLWFAINKL